MNRILFGIDFFFWLRGMGYYNKFAPDFTKIKRQSEPVAPIVQEPEVPEEELEEIYDPYKTLKEGLQRADIWGDDDTGWWFYE